MKKEKEIEIINLPKEKDLYLLLVGAKYIGSGKISHCFLLKDGSVLKIYKNSKKKQELFKKKDMLEQIILLNTLKKESYIVPDQIFVYQTQVIAYKTEYRHAKTLAKLNPFTPISDILLNLDKLIENTYQIGEKKFRLKDLHNKNILFDKEYYIIDLDFGKIENKSMEEITKYNIRDIIENLLKFLFAIKEDEFLIIQDSYLYKLYKQAIY